MKTLRKIIDKRNNLFNFAEFYYEHNGRKFKVHYEATGDMPCASRGNDWYQSLSVMTNDGTWEQVTDAEILGAVSHYDLYRHRTDIAFVEKELNKAEKIFKQYITEIY